MKSFLLQISEWAKPLKLSMKACLVTITSGLSLIQHCSMVTQDEYEQVDVLLSFSP